MRVAKILDLIGSELFRLKGVQLGYLRSCNALMQFQVPIRDTPDLIP